MLRGLLRLIGLGGRDEGPSIYLDFDGTWTFSRIEDKHLFLKWVLSVVPDGAVWSIEGVRDPAILDVLRGFSVNDNLQIPRATIWPRQRTQNVLLTEASKATLGLPPVWLALPVYDLSIGGSA
jgi:hypothetical protein